MKKNNSFKFFLVIGMMIPFLFAACDEEKDITYKVKVISAGSDVQGYYFYDDSSTVTFDAAATLPAPGNAAFDGKFKNPDNEVHVYAVTTAPSTATSLKIYLYKEGSSVLTVTGVRIGGSPSNNFEAILDYKIVPEEDKTTTGTPATTY